MMRKSFGLLVVVLLWSSIAVAADDAVTDLRSAMAAYNVAIEAREFEKAQAHALAAYGYGKDHFAAESQQMGALAYNVGFSARRAGDTDTAIEYLEESLAVGEEVYGDDNIRLIDPLLELAEIYVVSEHVHSVEGRRSAFEYGRRALRLIGEEMGRDNQLYARTALMTGGLARVMPVPADRRRAPDYIEAAYDFYKRHDPDGPNLAQSALELGKWHLGERHEKRAEERLLEAANLFSSLPGPPTDHEVSARSLLVGLYERLGDEEKSTEQCIAIGKLQSDREIADYRPLYKIAPRYPRRALSTGREGYTIVEFTVTETGRIADPVIVESSPEGIFDEASLDAARKFRYAPRVENGKPMPVSGVRNLITFKLDRGRRNIRNLDN